MEMEKESLLLTEDECYAKLKDAIRTGALMPNQRLVEMDMAKAFHAARATVRTALARLEQEGLVERERYRGARVRMVTEREAVEIMEVRTALECVTVRHAAQNATEEDCKALEEIIAEMERHYRVNDLLEYSEGNARLHGTLIRMARHTTAAKVLDTLNTQSVRFQYRTILSQGRPELSLAEHKEIVDAVVRRDPDAAEQAMRKHLQNVLDTLRALHTQE
ncbi:GntR family transcriptional regulator [Alicyclobacillus contaminans]|uniref:GntR family transcriptional regulator n=1 Tax=Alicyclobacillus contaminans TaxID=392016 RepID=UPI001FDFAD4A|nr:GntR family transcriptional regulator [Alicyclobacillus contaminans]GMA49696.1 GntR family transcriptional regulator [Alicyclobacillus contaminans]